MSVLAHFWTARPFSFFQQAVERQLKLKKNVACPNGRARPDSAGGTRATQPLQPDSLS